MGELANRFIECCKGISGAEFIDDLPMTGEQKANKKADFFFQGRTIVCEIKSLESDPSEKFIAYLESQGVVFTPDTHYPDLIGYVKDRPNGDAIWKKAQSLATTAVEDGLSSGNKQIRTTKKLFGIESADGLLVILNGVAPILGPQLVLERIGERMMKPNATNDGPYHEQLSQILLMSENYLLDTAMGPTATAIPIASEAIPQLHEVYAFLPTLMEAWTKCNGRQFEVMDIPNLHD
jgi:hypothetical protein